MASFPTDAPRAFPLPTVPEDTLHYVLHLPPSLEGQSTELADAVALATLISTHVHAQLPHPWLWNKDAWELKAAATRLSGTMRVGDSVDDEWLVVWLLRDVSRLWPELVISIRDTDGEFLLIEAANELPDWVSPENAENRLWLCGGHLHLIPLSIRSSSASRPKQLSDSNYDDSGRAFDPDAWVSEADAIAAVRTGKYRADARMENAVWDRISCYPAALKTHQHYAKAYLPEPVARALRSSPALIQRAVEGFYVRDPAQLRAASRMTHFPPSPAVLSSVLMTRAAYAQLQGQVFHPPRVFGPEWHVAEGKENEDERRWRDLGVKIATGFEIMYREGGRKGRAADVEASVDDLRADSTYQKYIADLKKAGFFGNELEGSAEWKKREAEAAKGWVKARSSDTTQQRQSFAYLVDKAIEKSAAVPATDLTASKDSPEDNDKWLEVDPEQVDAMLMRSAGPRGAASTGNPELGGDDGRALQELASKVQEFIGGQGDLQGARFADELFDDDDGMDSDSDEEPEPSAEEKKERMAKLVPSLPAEEWGRRTQPSPPKSDEEMASEPVVPKTRKGVVAGTELGDSMLPLKMRPPVFAKQEFDGVVSDSSDEDEGDLPPPGSLGRKIMEMKWGDGAPKGAHIEELSDGEGDAEDKADRARARELKFDDDELDELMRQRVWGDGNADENKEEEHEHDHMDVDMDQEQEDFLKFSREALGISDEMWDNIIKSRQERGAFVPKPSTRSEKKTPTGAPKFNPSAEKMDTDAPAAGTSGGKNMALDSFESMMAAMEAELERAKQEKGQTGSSTEAPAKVQFKKPASSSSSSKPKGGKKGKGKSKLTKLSDLPTEADLDNMDDDELAAMDAELRLALEDAGEGGDDDVPEAAELSEDQQREYRMMRDLLESASQGHGGAASALLSRLGEGMGKKP